MRPEDSYKPGEIVFYHEMGEVDKVEVLGNKSDQNYIRYKLKVLQVVQESKIAFPSNIGEVFNCEAKRNSGGFSGLWHLLETP